MVPVRHPSDNWDLAWEKEASPLEVNPRACTFIINPSCDAGDALEKLREKLKGKKFAVENESGERSWPGFKATYLKSEVLASVYEDTMVVNTIGARAKRPSRITLAAPSAISASASTSCHTEPGRWS